jgi:hypothetical protein
MCELVLKEWVFVDKKLKVRAIRSKNSQIAGMENLNSTSNTTSILLFRSCAFHVQCSKNQPCRKLVRSVALSCMMRTIWPTRPFCRTHNMFIDKWHKSYRAQTREYGTYIFCSQSYSARRPRQPVLSQYKKKLIFFVTAPTYYFNSQFWCFHWGQMTINGRFHYAWSIQC